MTLTRFHVCSMHSELYLIK